MHNLTQLEERMLTPTAALVEDISRIRGDIVLLGVGGKMGPSMARLARRAVDKAGTGQRIIGVSRFSDAKARASLEASGVETVAADLLNERELAALPDAPNVIYLAGQKFGTSGREAFTWAMNAYLPGRVAERYRNSRIVAFSTGNVYPFSSVSMGGFSEEQSPDPKGEYGQSCLGRERIFQYFAEKYNIPVLIYRLNYAIDFRYGVLLEIAKSVKDGVPIDLSTGHVNVIWQGDANEIALRALLHCSTPAKLLNVTGPETVSVRWLAHQFGELFGQEPTFLNTEQPTALLSNAAEAHRLFGYPKVTLKTMIQWTTDWLLQGGEMIDKPTHFQERNGEF